MVQIKPELDPEDDSLTEDHITVHLQESGINIDDIRCRHGPFLVELSARDKQVQPNFMSAEHGFLGDSIGLTQWNGEELKAKDSPLDLKNGLKLTYGEINALAGDFYGTDKPISDANDIDEQCRRFVNAYNTLAENQPRQPREATRILEVVRREITAINKAISDGKTPSEAYSKWKFPTLEFIKITLGRPHGQPGFLGLANINWDHWGRDARTAYNAGHTAALRVAAGGKREDLYKAYSMNAFADHFLEDCFAAGHIRGPRRKLTEIEAARCVLKMHDEDNAIGLKVQDPQGETWTMYGDKRLRDSENAENLRRCTLAIQASADEVFRAWKSGSSEERSENFKAWEFACTIESARGPQELAPLFRFDDAYRRKDVNDRRLWEFEKVGFGGYKKLLKDIEDSKKWNYPMKLD